MNVITAKKTKVLLISSSVALLVFFLAAVLWAQTVPRYLFDPMWPKPLPNK